MVHCFEGLVSVSNSHQGVCSNLGVADFVSAVGRKQQVSRALQSPGSVDPGLGGGSPAALLFVSLVFL